MSRDLITYSVYILDNTNIWLTVFIVLSRHTKTAIWLRLHCIFHFSFFSPQFFVVRLNRINGEQKKAKQIPLNCSIFMEFASPGSKGICNGPGTGRSYGPTVATHKTQWTVDSGGMGQAWIVRVPRPNCHKEFAASVAAIAKHC